MFFIILLIPKNIIIIQLIDDEFIRIMILLLILTHISVCVCKHTLDPCDCTRHALGAYLYVGESEIYCNYCVLPFLSK